MRPYFPRTAKIPATRPPAGRTPTRFVSRRAELGKKRGKIAAPVPLDFRPNTEKNRPFSRPPAPDFPPARAPTGKAKSGFARFTGG